jgi:hypothetical protein
MEDEGDNVLSSNEANAEVMLSSKIAEGGAGYVRGREEGRKIWPSLLLSSHLFYFGPEITPRQRPNTDETAPVPKVEEMAQTSTSPALEPMAPAQEEAAKTDEIVAPPAALQVEEVAQTSAALPVPTEAPPPLAQESATPKPSSPVVASAPSPAPQGGTGLTAPAKVDRASSGQVLHETPQPSPAQALWKQPEPART